MPLSPDAGIDNGGGPYVPEGIPPVFADAGYCGRSFNGGLLRFHDGASGPEFRELVRQAFPEIEDPAADVLAFDWQGRQVVTIREKAEDGSWGEVGVAVAELGSGHLIPMASLPQFVGGLQAGVAGAVFGEQEFAAFRAHAGLGDAPLAFTQCVEYTVPLFLGGPDDVSNMAVIDTSVHWVVGGQIRVQVMGGQGG